MTPPPSAEIEFCEVYDEPRHRFRLRNAWTNVYEIELPHDEQTLFHRHSEDTVYFVIADAEVHESFPDKAPVTTRASAGGTLCRGHKHEPLIHQVRNLGAGVMHMLGAEALARPPVVGDLQLEAHARLWESSRFRVFDVAVDDNPVTVRYAVYGLLVSFRECTFTSPADSNNGYLATGLSPGGFVWIEPAREATLPAGFRGIFAQWI